MAEVNISRRDALKKIVSVGAAIAAAPVTAAAVTQGPELAKQAVNFINKGIAPELDKTGYQLTVEAQDENAKLERAANATTEVDPYTAAALEKIKAENSTNPDMQPIDHTPTKISK